MTYLEGQNLKSQIKEKLVALGERNQPMTAEEIETALRMNFCNFGSFVISRRVSSSSRMSRTFSQICDVYRRSSEGGMERMSPASGWKIKKAALEVFRQLQPERTA